MRIGELTVFSSQNDSHQKFIKNICNKIEIISNDICIGRLPISGQLMLQFYGINMKDVNNYSFDLLSPKVLGYIFLFNWDDKDSIEPIREMIDHLSTNFRSPIIVAAMVNNYDDLSVPKKFYEPEGFLLDSLARFTFCDLNDISALKKIIASLINIILNRMA